MNTQNFASLEACKRLVEAGIVLKTEAYWIRVANSPMMLVDNRHGADEYYPAPSMAEVWRELPLKESSDGTYARLLFYSHGISWITNADESFFPYKECGENPTDALIDLLIFVRKGKP